MTLFQKFKDRAFIARLWQGTCVVAVVAVEAFAGYVVGSQYTDTDIPMLAGVILFVGLEAMRHWRMQMRRTGK
ncbi:hypothetical protein V8N76_004529 [Salmonella enterica]